MSENKEPAIMLFGRTIPLQPSDGACGGEEKDVPTKEATTSESDNRSQDSPDSQEKIEPPKSMSNEFSEMPSDDKEEAASTDKPTSEEQQDHLTSPKGEALKKPDKVLPCPRCNSMDTKFCYYNNYKVNQPRHFCKKCQRYWTAGGTMRNVPVGSGRRKSKSSNHHYQMLARPPPHAVRTDAPDGIGYPLNPNGTVLTFGSDTPVCDSMASTLNFAEKKMNSNRNGFQMEEMMASAPPRPPEDGNGQSSMSQVSSPSSNGLTTSSAGNEKAVQASIADPCFSESPLSYPWIPAPLCGPSFPIPFYPAAAYWSCTVAPGTWSTPLISPVENAPVLPGSQGTGPSSPLGKHTREGDAFTKGEENNQGRAGIWIPKTLRIHDPEEAAKSSIWALVGARSGTKTQRTARGTPPTFCMPTLRHCLDHSTSRTAPREAPGHLQAITLYMQ